MIPKVEIDNFIVRFLVDDTPEFRPAPSSINSDPNRPLQPGVELRLKLKDELDKEQYTWKGQVYAEGKLADALGLITENCNVELKLKATDVKPKGQGAAGDLGDPRAQQAAPDQGGRNLGDSKAGGATAQEIRDTLPPGGGTGGGTQQVAGAEEVGGARPAVEANSALVLLIANQRWLIPGVLERKG